MMAVLEVRHLFQTELCRPQAFFFRDNAPRAGGFKAILDHLIHLRYPDPEDLSQDLLGHLEFQRLGIHPRSAMYHSSLLWTY